MAKYTCVICNHEDSVGPVFFCTRYSFECPNCGYKLKVARRYAYYFYFNNGVIFLLGVELMLNRGGLSFWGLLLTCGISISLACFLTFGICKIKTRV